VNGELKATCGIAGLRQIVGMVAAYRPASDGEAEFACRVECVGVRPKDSTTEEVLKWVHTRIVLGDEVTFKVVNVEQADEPFDRQNIAASNAPDS